MNNLYGILIIVCLAIGLDFVLMRWLRKSLANQAQISLDRSERVYFLKGYSPVLTWLKRGWKRLRFRIVKKESKIGALTPLEKAPTLRLTSDEAQPKSPSLPGGLESRTFNQLSPEHPYLQTNLENEPPEAEGRRSTSVRLPDWLSSQPSWRLTWLEILLIGLGVSLYCRGILDIGTSNQLPGNEAQLFQSIDWIFRDSLVRYHRFPLWNPAIHTGLPYLGDPMLHIYNPVVSIPVLIFGVYDGFKLALFFSFLLAALGMWRLGGVLGMGPPLRVWAGLMFAFGGQPAARFFQGEYLLVFGFAWIPWVLVNFIKLYETRRNLFIALSGLSLALLYFCGNAYYTFLIFFILLLLALVTLFKFQPIKPWISLDLRLWKIYAIAGLLAMGLAALQLFPSIEFWPRMNKGVDVQGSHTLGQIFLDYTSKDTFRPDAYSQLPAREEFYAYIGYTPFLALLALPLAWKKISKRTLLFLGLILFFTWIWIDLDRMPWRDFYYQTKFLSQFRHVLRALIFGGLALMGLAAIGLDALLKTLYHVNQSNFGPRWQKSLRAMSAVGIGAVFLFMAAGVGDIFYTNSRHVHTQEDYPPIYHVMQWLRNADEGEFYVRNNPNNGWLMAVLTSHLRFIDAWYHWNDIRNFDGQLNLRAVNARPNYVVQVESEPPPADVDASIVHQLEGYVIYRLPHSLPFAFSTPLFVLKDANNENELTWEEVSPWQAYIYDSQNIEIIAQGNSGDILTTLVTHYPGWQVRIDGRPARLEKVGGYLAARMQPGVHKYTFFFLPLSFYFGLIISLLCLGITLRWAYKDSAAERLALSEMAHKFLRQADKVKQIPIRWFGQKQYRISAIYQNKTLIPEQPLALEENKRVHIFVEAGFESRSVRRLAFHNWIMASNFLIRSLASSISLEGYFFLIALGAYFLTRLLWLADFPIYFFTDEAIQTVSAIDLVRNHFYSPEHILLPTYFKNGTFYNLSLSVYLQVIPYLLFGQSVYLTRLVAVLTTGIAAISVGLILKNNFRIPTWWAGTLFLSIAPAWFLHSRTAFETAIFASCYAGFLYLYLQYRQKSGLYLYPCLVMAALSFYAYSPGQVVLAATGVALFLSDLRYHWKQRKWIAGGIILLAILAIPYVRFIQSQSEAPFTHLRDLGSYWIQPLPLKEKVVRYAGEYFSGLNPLYWFFPNQHDLQRHMMKGYGHLLWWTLPFGLVGFWRVIRNLRYSHNRVLLISCLAAPTGSALVGIGITRVLVFVIPATLLITLGLADCLNWLENSEWKKRVGVRWGRKILPRLPSGGSKASYLIVGLTLLVVNFSLLRNAVVNGPTWYQDYGLYGTQYGARQIFESLVPELLQTRDQKVFVSSVWANGADIFPRFFLRPEQQGRVSMGSIDTYLSHKAEFEPTMVFVLTTEEYQRVLDSGKMEVLSIENIIPYPDGNPGFYSIRLKYTPQADELFRAEAAERKKPQEAIVQLEGQEVHVLYSKIDSGEITDLFDDDPYSLVRGLEANPFILDLEFSHPISISGLKLAFGSMDFSVSVSLYQEGETEPLKISRTYRNMPNDPQIEMVFSQQYTDVRRVRIEILNLNESESAKIHIREVKSIP